MPYLSIASGAISTDTQVRTGHGVLTYIEAVATGLTVFDGTSTTGLLLAQGSTTGVNISFNTPVKFGDGLFVSVASTTGIAVVHTG